MVYAAAAGIDPSHVLPVVIDAGTDRDSLLEDPFYLGVHERRVDDRRYLAFVDAFVEQAERMFPDLYLHFEDFGRDHAAKLLARYVGRYPVFNDDIEGTGIVSLAGVLGALKISGQALDQQRYVCFGAGTAGCGIVRRMFQEMLDQGMDEQDAKSRIYLVDRQGLLFDDMDGLTPEQRPFAHSRDEFAHADGLCSLQAVVDEVHPTILVGTSTQGGAFTREVVQSMAAHTARPIIFPLSNPTELAEAKAEDLIRWTGGRALVATGVPSAPVELDGVTYRIGQANNALVYPGLGLGVIASRSRLLTDRMVSAAAHAVGGAADAMEPGAAVLPPVSGIHAVSARVAEAVAVEARKEGLSRVPFDDAGKLVASVQWTPAYRAC